MNKKLLFLNVFLILFVVLLGTFLFIFDSVPVLDKQVIEIKIPKGMSSYQIADLLSKERLIRSKGGFLLLTKLTGAEGQLKAGLYRFQARLPLLNIINKMKKGETAFDGIKVTFPEGTSIYKMGQHLKNIGYGDWKKFQNLKPKSLSNKTRARFSFLGQIPINSLEGYLYPETYFIFLDTSLDKLAQMMLEEFEKKIYAYWRENQGASSLSLHKILTLSSIVEKEAAVSNEEPIIASVFYNRLKINMPLEADPTVKYVLERPTKKVYYDQLEVNSPYNTYKRYGLTPGPICNPGIDAFKSTLYPAQTDYLFFVARKNGTHIFSTNWADHQKARQAVK